LGVLPGSEGGRSTEDFGAEMSLCDALATTRGAAARETARRLHGSSWKDSRASQANSDADDRTSSSGTTPVATETASAEAAQLAKINKPLSIKPVSRIESMLVMLA